MPNTFPTSSLQLAPLQPADTPSLLDIRPFIGQLRSRTETDIFDKIQQAFDNLQQTIRSQSPELEYLSIDAADIGNLYVGSEFGPGQLTINNGPPNYDAIGWFGSAPNASPVAITSIVAGVVTTAAPHDMIPNDNVYIESTTDSTQTGYYVVATTPTASTFTVVGGFAGNSTGGFMTLQFQGGWLKTFAAGGTYFGDAPFQVDVNGELTITNARIILISGAGTITLDPNLPGIELESADGRIVLDATVPIINFYDDADVLFMGIGRIGAGGGDIGISIDNTVADMQIGQIGAGSADFGIIINNGSTTTVKDGITVINGDATDQASLKGVGDNTVITVQSLVDDSSLSVLSGGPGAFDDMQIDAADSTGTRRMTFGSAIGMTFYDAATVPVTIIDGSGNIDSVSYSVGGAPGASVSDNFGVSLSINNITNAVRGTPGVGQSNFTAVNTVTLNTTNYTFDGGLFVG